MDFSVKAINCQTNINSASKNAACQPIKPEFGVYKVNFGNGQSHVVNEHGDSISISPKNAVKANSEAPLSFGQKFIDAAIKVSQKLQGNKNDTDKIGKELGKELYGVEIN